MEGHAKDCAGAWPTVGQCAHLHVSAPYRQSYLALARSLQLQSARSQGQPVCTFAAVTKTAAKNKGLQSTVYGPGAAADLKP